MNCFIQDLSLNVHFYLDLFLHGCDIGGIRWVTTSYRVKNLHLSFGVSIKSTYLNGRKWLVQMGWKNFEKNRKFFGTVLKIWQKNTEQHFKKRDEVHFIVNLYSFSLPLFPQTNHPFHFSATPSRQNNFQISPIL